MRKILIATLATAFLGYAASAFADTLSYNILVGGVSIGSGSTTTGIVTGATASGDGFYVVLSAVGAPAQSAPYLSTNNFNIATAGVAGVLTVEVTDTGLTSPVTPVMNFFTTNSGDGGGFTSDTISNYYSNADTPYGTDTLLGTATYTGLDSFASTSPGLVDPTGTYSETTDYTLNFSAGTMNNSVSASSQIIAQTPEPSTLLLLGTGLIGAGRMVLVRRRQTA